MQMIFFLILLFIICIVVILIYLFYFTLQKQQDDRLEYAEISDDIIMPYILNNVLTKCECDKLIEISKDKLFDSQIVSGHDKKIRNSKQFWISKSNELARIIIEKLSKEFKIPFENSEDIQIVRYLPNQYYNEHHDSCCDDNENCKKFIQDGGQRQLTILIYLNDNFTDGETYFKNLNLKIKPNVGDAVVFYPLSTRTSKCHPLSLHQGLPVSSGEKWIANVWFRENKFK